MALIRQGKVVEGDTFQLIADDAALPASGDLIVGLARLRANAEQLSAHKGRLGVRVDPEDEPSAVAEWLPKLALVAIHFPKFGDGRGYSKARLLRERYGFKGELRAVGEVLADQLQYMSRCGIDAFELAAGKDVAAALHALHDFSVTYQAASDDPRPLYRRVARGQKTA
jgi:uncharacterized protein (DUF934 family)